jgi:hypothetical protein
MGIFILFYIIFFFSLYLNEGFYKKNTQKKNNSFVIKPITNNTFII